MTSYKHTQIGYLMIFVVLVASVFFVWTYITARAEPPSVNSGTNLLVTVTMALILFILVSFVTLKTSVDEKYLKIKFGYGIFTKKFALDQIISVRVVKNPWYCGWGIRVCFRPHMWIYNVSGFDAIEIIMRNRKIYRIGTDDASGLEVAIKQVINI